jgi:hypothetical protein
MLRLPGPGPREVHGWPHARQRRPQRGRSDWQAGKQTPAIRDNHRRVPPGKLSARSIQLGTAVAPNLPRLLHRMRAQKDGTGASSRQPSIVTARSWPPAASHEQATDALPVHAAEHRRADGSSSLAILPKLRTDRERN